MAHHLSQQNKALIANAPIYFILNIERSGSSMLSAMLNCHEQVLSPSEEPFLLYFYPQYCHKTHWTASDIDLLLDQFWLLAEKNLDLYFAPRNQVKQYLLPHLPQLDFLTLCRLLYAQFLPDKDKTHIDLIIDKQIKYLYYPEKILAILPQAKFIVLTRHYIDIIATWQKRKLGSTQQTPYIAKIWQIAYHSILPYLQQQHPQFMLLRYEDLVRQPQAELERICLFVGKNYQAQMLNFDQKTRHFFDHAEQQTALNPFVQHLKDFHSALLQPVNSQKIGIGQQALSKEDIYIAQRICENTALQLGYLPQTSPSINLPLWRKLQAIWYVARAWFSRRVYLRTYIAAPFKLKLAIKRLRPNTIRS
jgi:hypothetical protein